MFKVEIRWLLHADLPRVRAIEAACFGGDVHSPQALRTFLDVSTNSGLVAVSGHRVVGFVLFQIDPERALVTIPRFAVQPEHRRRGVGSRLLRTLTTRLATLPHVCILTRVRESDLASQLFLRANHFRAFKVLPLTEADGTEDAYLFRYERPLATPVAS
jgi:ribosomal protein S18 acetylase RimI-like enzyme